MFSHKIYKVDKNGNKKKSLSNKRTSENAVYIGSPAKLKKTNINWSREMPHKFILENNQGVTNGD